MFGTSEPISRSLKQHNEKVLRHYVVNKTPFYKKESFHRIKVNLNLSLNLKVMDNGRFNETAGYIYIFICLSA